MSPSQSRTARRHLPPDKNHATPLFSLGRTHIPANSSTEKNLTRWSLVVSHYKRSLISEFPSPNMGIFVKFLPCESNFLTCKKKVLERPTLPTAMSSPGTEGALQVAQRFFFLQFSHAGAMSISGKKNYVRIDERGTNRITVSYIISIFAFIRVAPGSDKRYLKDKKRSISHKIQQTIAEPTIIMHDPTLQRQTPK